MSKLTTKIAAAATLALAAIPMLALTTAAHAAPVNLKVGDLSTAAGVAAFEQRLDRVAKTMCAAQRLDVGTRMVKTQGAAGACWSMGSPGELVQLAVHQIAPIAARRLHRLRHRRARLWRVGQARPRSSRLCLEQITADVAGR
jgi:UrcA family protein